MKDPRSGKEERWSVYFSLFGKGADRIEWEYFTTYPSESEAYYKAKLLFSRLVVKGFKDASVRRIPVKLPAVPLQDPMPHLSSLIALATARRQLRVVEDLLWSTAGLCHSEKIAMPSLVAKSICDQLVAVTAVLAKFKK